MARLIKRMIVFLMSINLLASLSGCMGFFGEWFDAHEEELSKMADEYYKNETYDLVIKGKKISTKEEAQKFVLAELKKKYNKDFTLLDEGEMGKVKIDEETLAPHISYRVSFQDENGLEAQAILEPDITSGMMLYSGGGFDDTYSDTFYGQKAIKEIESIFSDAPVERYIISVSIKNLAEGDLSLSVKEYFNKGIEGKYKVYVFMPDNLSEEDYVETFADIYKRLSTKQEFPFWLEMHASGYEIAFTSWAKDYYQEDPLEVGLTP